MDFDQAIAAHSSWKRKLSTYLQKPDGSLKPAEVALDNKCDLGKWIAGEGAKFSSLKEFGLLKTEHTRFHKSAAAIVVRADKGEKVTDEVGFGANSDFGNASAAVVQAIMQMKVAASH
jgi:methyl-accepting chemotaxis protein